VPRIRSGVIAVLDIGSSKICCFIAQVTADNSLRVIGIGHQLSQGIRAGSIADIKQAEHSIIAAVSAAEKMADETIDKVVLCTSGGGPSSTKITAEVEIHNPQVSPRDIKRAIIQAKEAFADENRRIIHAVPVSFAVDDIRGVDDPVGMAGKKLTAEIHLITVSESAIRNIANCVTNCELEIQDYVVSSHAAGLTCLTEDERELGVTLIEMGGGTTGISVFMHGKNILTDSIPYGGINVTSDIARGFATTKEYSERIKNLYGGAISSGTDGDTLIDIQQLSEETGDYTEEVAVPKSDLVNIIQPRMEEIFEMIKKKLANTGTTQIAGQHYVLSGGASQLVGVRELASKTLGGHVRLGRPDLIEGMADSTANPAFSACAGLINYISMNYHVYDKVVPVDRYIQNTRFVGGGSLVDNVVGWIKKNF